MNEPWPERLWSPRCFTLVFALAISSVVHGEEPRIRLSGYLTLGATYHDGASTGIIRSHRQNRAIGPGWSTGFDNVVGLQADYELSDRDNLVLQLRARGNESLKPLLRLGFWQHDWSSQGNVRLGRIAPQDYADSEIANVGFANLLVRPPLPVYAKLNALEYLDGLEINWNRADDKDMLSAKLYVGSAKYRHRVFQSYESLDVDIQNKWGAVLEYRHGHWRWRASYSQANRYRSSSPDLDRLNDVLGQLAIALPSRAAQLTEFLDPFNASPTYASLGGEWSDAKWRASGELTTLKSSARMIGEGVAWSFFVSRSFGHITPYAFTSHQVWRRKALDLNAFASTGDVFLDAGLAGLSEQIRVMHQATDLSMRNNGVGLRIELRQNRAIKLQWEVVDMNEPYAPIAGGRNGTVRLLSLVVDVIF